MPNINDINGVTIANLSKLDGVTKANIAKVLGITLEAAAAFLLDTYTGAAAGYSVRRIASSATNLMRIREDSGDTETDIGYDSNGDLDTAAIASHCGTANGFVVSWVDQSGNSNDADQSTNANQPKIYDGTTQAVITENGKPAIDFNGSGQHFIISNFINPTTNAIHSAIGVARPDQNDNVLMNFTDGTELLSWAYGRTAGTLTARTYDGTTIDDVSRATTISNQFLAFSKHDFSTPDTSLWIDGVTATGTNAGRGDTTKSTIGDGPIPGFFEYNGVWQELMIYPSDQSSNRTGIETDVNTEYLIYQPTDAPTSGLLATYTGAAAAYSVRQLADTAVIAITVRRDSDDEEKRFGFDSNGDLDTTGIADFCTTANGYVSQWWDQSTNGNHASQSTAGSQPQIYNGTAVITENGKPAIDIINFGLHATGLTYSITNASVFAVAKKDDVPVSYLSTLWRLGDGATRQNEFTIWHDRLIRDTINIRREESGTVTNASATSVTEVLSQHVMTGIQTSSQMIAYVNGTNKITQSLSPSSISLTSIDIGAEFINQAGVQYEGRIQEIIIYHTDQDGAGNRTGIETNLNDYFSIY